MVSRVEGTSRVFYSKPGPLPTRFEPFSKRYTAPCRNKPSINIIDNGVVRGAMANRKQQGVPNEDVAEDLEIVAFQERVGRDLES